MIESIRFCVLTLDFGFPKMLNISPMRQMVWFPFVLTDSSLKEVELLFSEAIQVVSNEAGLANPTF